MTGRSNCRAFWIASCSPLSNIRPDTVSCRALDGFGRHRQAVQELQLLAAAIEGGFLAYQSPYAAHPGRKLCVLEVPVRHPPETGRRGIGSTSSRDGRRTYGAYDRQDGFAADFLVLRVMATTTRQPGRCAASGGASNCSSSVKAAAPVWCRAARTADFYSFQIRPAVLPALRKDPAEELIYFPRHLPDGSQQPFFSAPSSHPVAARPGGSTDLFVEGDQVLAELLER